MLVVALAIATTASHVAAQSHSDGALAVQTPQSVAGHSLEETEKLVSDENRTVRLRAAKSLAAFGQEAGPVLRRALDHDDAAVRYTVAVGLGRVGGEALIEAQSDLHAMMSQDSSEAMRMASAFALCRIPQADAKHMAESLDVLVKKIQTPSRAVACSAAELLGMLGRDATSAAKSIEEVAKNNRPGSSGDYHIGGAAQKALRQIQAEAR